MVGVNEFVLLNERMCLRSSRDWNDPEQEKLLLYNLHYFDDLNARDSDDRWEWHRTLISRWIQENPPGVGTGWEPYPVSLRVVNWIKWDLRVGQLDSEAVRSLALQLRWLRRRLEFHLLGNHLLANAKALVFGGVYFEGSEADEWLRTGRHLFDEQLDEQVLSDGGHFELSPMYHLIVLEDVLDVINLFQTYNIPVPKHWKDVAGRMLDWASVMRHPDGNIPFFNDAAFEVAGTFHQLSDYAGRLFGYHAPDHVGSAQLADSGYFRLANHCAVVFFDAALLGPDYLPGHGHADTLSLELSLFGQRVLVNSGTSLYGTGKERDRQRSTGAHNTVMVDGENSSEVWGGFRVARRARPRVIEWAPDRGLVVAEHDGYRRLVGRPVHRRKVTLSSEALSVTDIVVCEQASKGVRRNVAGAWHFHPSVQVEAVHSPQAASEGRFEFRVVFYAGGARREAWLTVRGASHAALEPSTWHPEFGRSIPNTRLIFSYDGSLPVTFVTELRWTADDSGSRTMGVAE